MKASFRLFTPPHVIFTLLFALSALAGCGGDGGSGDDLKKYVLSFDANGGEGEMENQVADEGAEITLAENAFTRDGYDFDGWNTSADGKGSDYADKATLTLAENMTLYAQWKKSASEAKISYTVKFDANGGEGEMKTQTAEEGAEITLTANAFTREGYTFSGWATSARRKHCPHGQCKNQADRRHHALCTVDGNREGREGHVQRDRRNRLQRKSLAHMRNGRRDNLLSARLGNGLTDRRRILEIKAEIFRTDCNHRKFHGCRSRSKRRNERQRNCDRHIHRKDLHSYI